VYEDLLEQAFHLATLDAKMPRQANSDARYRQPIMSSSISWSTRRVASRSERNIIDRHSVRSWVELLRTV
jgi:hypothetical protein